MDFGVIRNLGETTITETGEFLGTLRYASPEWILGKSTGYQTDLYSIGAIIYKLITKKDPFDAERNRASLTKAIMEHKDFEILLATLSLPPLSLQANAKHHLLEHRIHFLLVRHAIPVITTLGVILTLWGSESGIRSIDALITILNEGRWSKWWINNYMEDAFEFGADKVQGSEWRETAELL